MARALVTGGCGFLGGAIVARLLERGHAVRVLALPGEPLDGLHGREVEVARGDILERAACEAAVRGCDWVFHAAAIYAAGAVDPIAMYAVNVDGTFNVLEAARRAGVERVVATASIVALGRPEPGGLADEGTPYEAWGIDFPYSRSKYLGKRVAEGFARWGLDVRVVCPGIVLGPGDWRPTPSGKLILESVAPGPPVTVEGGASYVDVRDAAEVHLLAAERGAPGESYVAVSENLSNLQLAETIDRALGRRVRRLQLAPRVARALVAGMGELDRRRGREERLPLNMFDFSLRPAYFRNDKARRELGASFRPVEQSVRDAITDFRQRGML